MFLGMLGWHKHEFAPGTLFHGPIISFGYLERVVVAIQRERVEKGPQNFWMMRNIMSRCQIFYYQKYKKKHFCWASRTSALAHYIFIMRTRTQSHTRKDPFDYTKTHT